MCFFLFNFIFSVIRIQNLNMSDHYPKSIQRSAMMRCLISILNRQTTFACQIIEFWWTMMAAVVANEAAWCQAKTANRAESFRAPDAIYQSINDHWHDTCRSCQRTWTFGYISNRQAIKSHSAHTLLSIRSAVAGKKNSFYTLFCATFHSQPTYLCFWPLQKRNIYRWTHKKYYIWFCLSF